MLVDGEPKIGSDFLFLTSFSCRQRRDLLVQVRTFETRLAPLRHLFDPLLGGVVAYAVQLRFPAELGEHCVVVLVRLNMRVVRDEGEISAVDKDILEDVAVVAPQLDTLKRQVRHPF
jgi:hypothetical protein